MNEALANHREQRVRGMEFRYGPGLENIPQLFVDLQDMLNRHWDNITDVYHGMQVEAGVRLPKKIPDGISVVYQQASSSLAIYDSVSQEITLYAHNIEEACSHMNHKEKVLTLFEIVLHEFMHAVTQQKFVYNSRKKTTIETGGFRIISHKKGTVRNYGVMLDEAMTEFLAQIAFDEISRRSGVDFIEEAAEHKSKDSIKEVEFYFRNRHYRRERFGLFCAVLLLKKRHRIDEGEIWRMLTSAYFTGNINHKNMIKEFGKLIALFPKSLNMSESINKYTVSVLKCMGSDMKSRVPSSYLPEALPLGAFDVETRTIAAAALNLQNN